MRYNNNSNTICCGTATALFAVSLVSPVMVNVTVVSLATVGTFKLKFAKFQPVTFATVDPAVAVNVCVPSLKV